LVAYPPRIPFLVSKGVTREMRVVFSPSNNCDLKAARVVRAGDLAATLAVACELKMISPSGICASLRKKANAADASLKKGNVVASANQLNAFLNDLKAQGGKHIKEPALTILREEAEALLKSIGPDGKVVESKGRAKRR
jgi:hypothetical protein